MYFSGLPLFPNRFTISTSVYFSWDISYNANARDAGRNETHKHISTLTRRAPPPSPLPSRPLSLPLPSSKIRPRSPPPHGPWVSSLTPAPTAACPPSSPCSNLARKRCRCPCVPTAPKGIHPSQCIYTLDELCWFVSADTVWPPDDRLHAGGPVQ